MVSPLPCPNIAGMPLVFYKTYVFMVFLQWVMDLFIGLSLHTSSKTVLRPMYKRRARGNLRCKLDRSMRLRFAGTLSY